MPQQTPPAETPDRKVFDDMIARTTNPETIARIEIAREYFTNPEFRSALEELTWQINNPQG